MTNPLEVAAPIGTITDGEYEELAWGLNGIYKQNANSFKPMVIYRPKCKDHDIRFEMMFSGICHSDLHYGTGDLGPMNFPMVPGHELLGKVVEVGSKVTKAKIGEIVGVGCMVDSCLKCTSCKNAEEQYCDNGFVHTYADPKKYSRVGGNPNLHTFGGYSKSNTVHEHFVFKIPSKLDPAKAAPILCAGITLWDPLVHWKAKNGGMTIGIAGIGGLGTMGIKLASAMGNTVVALSSGDSKKDMAISKGAKHYVNYNNEGSKKAWEGQLDLIIDTISANHQVANLFPLLKRSGTVVLIGLTSEPMSIKAPDLIFRRRQVTGSLIGGTKSTQELLEFCAKHQVYPDVILVTADKIGQCWDKLLTNKAGSNRFVIDIAKSVAMCENNI